MKEFLSAIAVTLALIAVLMAFTDENFHAHGEGWDVQQPLMHGVEANKRYRQWMKEQAMINSFSIEPGPLPENCRCICQ